MSYTQNFCSDRDGDDVNVDVDDNSYVVIYNILISCIYHGDEDSSGYDHNSD